MSPRKSREIPTLSGVYQIRCNQNGKIYIGSAVNLEWRWHSLAAVVHKGFIAPGGAVVRITNLSAFCRAAGLCEAHMFELKNGKRPSHKGWTWKHDADQAFDA